MVRCSDLSLYTGVTTDPQRRLQEHNGIGNKGARYTRVRRPVELVWFEPADNRSDACKREYQIKRLSRTKKIALVAYQSNLRVDA